MCCEGLLCASCAGPVVEARCGACTAAKARVHTGAVVHVPEWVAALAVLLLTLLTLAATYAR